MTRIPFCQQEVSLKKKKKQIRYLGHVISRKEVEMDPEKVEVVREWPEPHSIKALRGFLGLTGHYKRFIKDCVRLLDP